MHPKHLSKLKHINTYTVSVYKWRYWIIQYATNQLIIAAIKISKRIIYSVKNAKKAYHTSNNM